MRPVTVSRSSIFGPNVVRQMEIPHNIRMRPVTVSRSSIFGGTGNLYRPQQASTAATAGRGMGSATVSRSSIFGPNVVRQMQERGPMTRMAPVTVSRSRIFGENIVRQMEIPHNIRMRPVTVSRSSIFGSTKSYRGEMPVRAVGTRSSIAGIISRSPTGRGIASAIPSVSRSAQGSGSTRTGVLPPSTLLSQRAIATGGVFGGAPGGMGAGVAPGGGIPGIPNTFAGGGMGMGTAAALPATAALPAAAAGGMLSGGGMGAAPLPTGGSGSMGIAALPGGGEGTSSEAGGIGDSISNISGGVMDTITGVIPLAIKIILAVIIIKIVLWLLRGRR